MSDSVSMRSWYVPVEIVTLRRWIVAAFVVNVLLLTVDYLRADSELLMLGILSSILFAALRLPIRPVEILHCYSVQYCLVLVSTGL